MIEDELLKWRFKRGSKEALQQIYEKYLNYLLTLAMGLLHNASEAEDVVHDVFISLAQLSTDFKLVGNLKSYLATCVINRSRDIIRSRKRISNQVSPTQSIAELNEPEHSIISSEESLRLNFAIAQIPQDQREVIVLHLKGQMKFREIAEIQGVSVNTVQGRYRYGLDKLKSILNGEAKK